MATAIVGAGCTVNMVPTSDSSGALESGTSAFGDVVSFDLPDATTEAVDVTPLNASAHEFIAGLVDYGEFSFDVNLQPSKGYPTISAEYTVEITFSDSAVTTWSFNAFLTGFEGTAGGPDDAITASVTLKVTGTVSVT